MSAIRFVPFGGTISISGVTLDCTSSTSPEQYDAFLSGQRIGYLRLRWGEFYAAFPDVGGEIVYAAEIGDMAPCFTDEQRGEHLPLAVRALLARVKPDAPHGPGGKG